MEDGRRRQRDGKGLRTPNREERVERRGSSELGRDGRAVDGPPAFWGVATPFSNDMRRKACPVVVGSVAAWVERG